MMRTMPTARKVHRCDICAGDIPAGARYTRDVYGPWTLVQEDPEDRPTKLGGWVTQRFHLDCYPY